MAFASEELLRLSPAFERSRKLSDDAFNRAVQLPQLLLEGAAVCAVDLHVELHNSAAKKITKHLGIIAT